MKRWDNFEKKKKVDSWNNFLAKSLHFIFWYSVQTWANDNVFDGQ